MSVRDPNKYIDALLKRITCQLGNLVDILLDEKILEILLYHAIGVEEDDVEDCFHAFQTELPDKLSLARKAHFAEGTSSYIRWNVKEWNKLVKLLDEIERIRKSARWIPYTLAYLFC